MPSRANVMAPASGPNWRTHANAKSSEIDSRESIDGTFSVKNPLAIVSAPNTIHSRGTLADARTYPHQAAMARPARTTETTSVRVRAVTLLLVPRPRAAPDHVVRVGIVAAAPDDVLAGRRLNRAAPDHVVAARPSRDLPPHQTVRRDGCERVLETEQIQHAELRIVRTPEQGTQIEETKQPQTGVIVGAIDQRAAVAERRAAREAERARQRRQ